MGVYQVRISIFSEYLLFCILSSRPPQIVLVNFKKASTKSAKQLLRSFQKIGKVATELQKVATSQSAEA